jgi:aryl-alcohol dehydrogenase-like predicted oxidoreductase
MVEVAAVQIRFNLLDREAALPLFDLVARTNITLLTWGSLAEGLLTGNITAASTFDAQDRRRRYANFLGDEFATNLAMVARVRAIAARLGKSPAQVALRWLLDTRGVGCALFGAKTPRQVDDNLGACGWSLSPNDYAELESLTHTVAA